MPDFVPIIQSVLTATGIITAAVLTAKLGVRSYHEQKDIDRKAELRKSKEEAYLRYLKADDALWEFSWYSWWESKDDPQNEDLEKEKARRSEAKALRSEYNIAISNLYLLAPDDVILAVSRYHWSNDPTGHTPERSNDRTSISGKQLYSTMIMVMRQDVFEATELNVDQFGEQLPWTWSPHTTDPQL